MSAHEENDAEAPHGATVDASTGKSKQINTTSQHRRRRNAKVRSFSPVVDQSRWHSKLHIGTAIPRFVCMTTEKQVFFLPRVDTTTLNTTRLWRQASAACHAVGEMALYRIPAAHPPSRMYSWFARHRPKNRVKFSSSPDRATTFRIARRRTVRSRQRERVLPIIAGKNSADDIRRRCRRTDVGATDQSEGPPEPGGEGVLVTARQHSQVVAGEDLNRR